MTAAAFLSVYACQVYDESDLAGPDESEPAPTGGRVSTGGAPFVPMTNAGSGGTIATGGAGSRAGGGAGGTGGRGGITSGATGGMSASSNGGSDVGPGGDAGSPGGAAEPGTGGMDNPGGAIEPGGGSPAMGGGGTTGGTETGGSSTGGMPIAPELIDDGEDRNNRVRLNQGRNGYWSTFGPTTCMATPTNTMATSFMTAVSGGSGEYAVHFTAKGGDDDSCGCGFNLLDPKDVYDASAYSAVGFSARSESGEQTIFVKFVTPGTDPDFEYCDENAAADSHEQCYDHFFAEVLLDDTWRDFTVVFEDLLQEGWGFEPPDGFDPAEIVGIQWVAKPGTANLWIDDVKFVE